MSAAKDSDRKQVDGVVSQPDADNTPSQSGTLVKPVALCNACGYVHIEKDWIVVDSQCPRCKSIDLQHGTSTIQMVSTTDTMQCRLD